MSGDVIEVKAFSSPSPLCLIRLCLILHTRYASLDGMIDRVNRKLRKFKEVARSKLHTAGGFSLARQVAMFSLSLFVLCFIVPPCSVQTLLQGETDAEPESEETEAALAEPGLEGASDDWYAREAEKYGPAFDLSVVKSKT